MREAPEVAHPTGDSSCDVVRAGRVQFERSVSPTSSNAEEMYTFLAGTIPALFRRVRERVRAKQDQDPVNESP